MWWWNIIDPVFVLNSLDICRQCILKAETDFHCETDWDNLCTIEYMGQIFSDEAAKKCDKCRQMHYIGKSVSHWNSVFSFKIHCLQMLVVSDKEGVIFFIVTLVYSGYIAFPYIMHLSTLITFFSCFIRGWGGVGVHWTHPENALFVCSVPKSLKGISHILVVFFRFLQKMMGNAKVSCYFNYLCFLYYLGMKELVLWSLV